MNPYLLEKEMLWRMAELRQDVQRSHRLANPLARLFRSWRAGRRPSAVCADVVRAAEPGPA
jgi:hypothetical protein